MSNPISKGAGVVAILANVVSGLISSTCETAKIVGNTTCDVAKGIEGATKGITEILTDDKRKK